MDQVNLREDEFSMKVVVEILDIKNGVMDRFGDSIETSVVTKVVPVVRRWLGNYM